METQHWRGLQLDKDLVLRGNKEYGPENCVFVPSFVNTALHAKQEGLYPLGVAMWNDQRKKCFVSQCSSKLKSSSKYLGYFSTVDEAHRAWQKAKIEGLTLIIDQYSLMESCDPRVLKTLFAVVEQLKNDVLNNVETRSL